MHWYKRYPGDYRRDTGHLSVLEHGAYALLLDAYYGNGKPLPADLESLCRIAGARTPAENDAVQKVADQYFPLNGDGTRHNGRADLEIERWNAQANVNRQIATNRSTNRATIGETNRTTNRSTIGSPIRSTSRSTTEPDRTTNRQRTVEPAPETPDPRFAAVLCRKGHPWTGYPLPCTTCSSTSTAPEQPTPQPADQQPQQQQAAQPDPEY